MAEATSGSPGLGQPIDGMLAASRARRVEALEHLMSAAVELSLAAKAMADAVERAAEFGRAWLEVSDGPPADAAPDANEPSHGEEGEDGNGARAWVDGLQLVQRSAVPLFEGLARSLGGVTAERPPNGSARSEPMGTTGQ